MPETPTGLHTPVTNIPPTESTITEELISEGSDGFGDVLELREGAQDEAVPRPPVRESAFIVEAPDTTGLLDIGVASFGVPPARESILGTDERVQINETKQIPWRLSASLLMTAADNSQWIGTGWFISPRTLVTAGHCVFIKNSGVPGRDGFIKKMQVMPGRNGSELPFGAVTATEFWTVKGWAENGLETLDYGAIILPTKFAKEIGHFEFGVLKDNSLLNAIANVGGYPGDKPPGSFWYDKRDISNVNPQKVFYAADTMGGQSGACVYIVRNRKRVGVAIHAYGGATANSGTRISSQVFANLTAWKRF